MRPDAGASALASGVRSPMLMASPAKPLKSARVTAQSATGTCQGPTIWSRCVKPPTLRSPIVIRKRLEPTVGLAKTSMQACRRSTPLRSSGAKLRCTLRTSRCIRGGLPSSTLIGMWTGAPTLVTSFTALPPEGAVSPWGGPAAKPGATRPACLSVTTRSRSSVATPTTANGQRSRSHRAWNMASDSGAIAST